MRTAAPVVIGSEEMPAALQRGPQRRRQAAQILARADQQDLDLAGLGQHPVEIRRRQRSGISQLPAMDAGGQAQQRAAMRHVGKAEAAIAIGVDRRAAGKMRLADFDAFAMTIPPACRRRSLPWLSAFSSSAAGLAAAA